MMMLAEVYVCENCGFEAIVTDNSEAKRLPLKQQIIAHLTENKDHNFIIKFGFRGEER